MTSRWSHNLFKGRIGEAVTEAVLTEFGYVVRRGGYELYMSGQPSSAPDLVVEYPPTGAKEWVEVKYRTARPTSVELDRQRILEYKAHYPNTILAICAAWSGAIYCARIEDLPVNETETQDNITLSLLDDYWKHISSFFPIVQKGDRLGRLWTELTNSLGSFGEHEIRGRGVEKLWDTETEDLVEYLSVHWTDDMLRLMIEEPNPERMTLEELWEKARHVNALALAEDLLGLPDGNPVEINTLMLAVQRALGNRGENQVTFDVRSLTKTLRPHWDRLGFDEERRFRAAWFITHFFMGMVSSAMKPAKPSR